MGKLSTNSCLNLVCSLFIAMSYGPVARAADGRVLQILNPAQVSKVLVQLPVNAQAELRAGDLLVAERQLGEVSVAMGQLKVAEIYHNGTALADVVHDGTEVSNAIFPKYPNIMAGDQLRRVSTVIARQQHLVTEVSMSYQDLFVDGQPSPTSFELSKSGMEQLTGLVADLAGVRASTLVIEGHTDQIGTAAENQVESLQRALTVRQFLVTQLGFDSNRLIAIGQGEYEGIDASSEPSVSARRISIRVIE